MALRVLMPHGRSGDVTPWGRIADGWSCLSWQSGQMAELLKNRIALGKDAPKDHPTFILIGCHVTSSYVLLCTPVLGRNVQS